MARLDQFIRRWLAPGAIASAPRPAPISAEQAQPFREILDYLWSTKTDIDPDVVTERFGHYAVNRARRAGLICEGHNSLGEYVFLLTETGTAAMRSLPDTNIS